MNHTTEPAPKELTPTQLRAELRKHTEQRGAHVREARLAFRDLLLLAAPGETWLVAPTEREIGRTFVRGVPTPAEEGVHERRGLRVVCLALCDDTLAALRTLARLALDPDVYDGSESDDTVLTLLLRHTLRAEPVR